jgi:hypothetical protein
MQLAYANAGVMTCSMASAVLNPRGLLDSVQLLFGWLSRGLELELR